MKNLNIYILSIFLLSLGFNASAQHNKKSPVARFFSKTPWTFNFGGHVIDDDGNPFSHLFDTRNSWNLLPYPSRFAIDGYIQQGWSFQGEIAYTQYKVGKLINNDLITGSYSFLSLDLNIKYDINQLIGGSSFLTPYVIAGYGYTMRTVAPIPNTFSANLGLGLNFWIFENLGFNAQTLAKFALREGTSNYLQHSVGIIYRFEYGMGNHPGRVGSLTFLKSTKGRGKPKRRRRR